MTQYYYKTSAPEVIAANQSYETEKQALSQAGEKLARHFGGRAYQGQNQDGFIFVGVRFTPQKSTDLWTAPNDDRGGTQTPRAKLKSPIKPELKEPHKALKADWELQHATLLPNGSRVDKRSLHAAIGLNPTELYFCSGSYLVFEHDGTVYATTPCKLAKHMTEITASDFDIVLAKAREATKKSA